MVSGGAVVTSPSPRLRASASVRDIGGEILASAIIAAGGGGVGASWNGTGVVGNGTGVVGNGTGIVGNATEGRGGRVGTRMGRRARARWFSR